MQEIVQEIQGLAPIGGLVLSGAGVVSGVAAYARCRHRRAKEARYTGEGFSVRELIVNPPKGRERKGRAHKHNVAAPALLVVNEVKPWRTMASTRGIWHTAGRDYDEPHGVIVGKTGHGKNDSHLDPMAANVILHRPESAVIFDVKGDMVREMAGRTPGAQYAYTCLSEHRRSSAINIIATPEMTELTAGALYPVEYEPQPFFNHSSKTLFTGAAEYLGYGESNIMEVRRLLLDRAKLKELAKENESIHAVMEGENKKSADEVVGTALLHLEALRHPEVARMFDVPSKISEPWFTDKETVWVCFPEKEIIGRFAGALFHNLRIRAKNSRRGTYFFADEAGSVLTLEGIDQCFQVGRGYRTYFMIVLQDLSQLIEKFGRHSVYSILGNAPLKIFGASDEPETREFLSSLSGTVQVRRRIYEHDGLARAWKRLFSSAGAPYTTREESRRGVLGEHVQALPKGSWIVYNGDPHSMELITAPPFSEWKDLVMPEAGRLKILGVPKRVGGAKLKGDGDLQESGVEASEPKPVQEAEPEGGEPEPADSGAQREEGRRCPTCEYVVSSERARFCESCGSRL